VSQLALLSDRRYWPLFWTQFFGAFNDNLFKTALVLSIKYRELHVFGLSPDRVVFLAGGIFILPFFLFSPIAGQLADKYQKNELMRWVKLLEIVAMAVGAAGLLLDQMALLVVVLFVMGFQSALFGPAKYSILPELVAPSELVGANAMVESGTFLSILLGTIAGGVVVALGPEGVHLTALGVVLLAVLGSACSFAIVPTKPGDPSLRVTANPLPAFATTFRLLRAERSVLLSVLGLSWFWFLGFGILSLMPVYCPDVLRGDPNVATLCLALFCVGIGAGSILCERLSQRRLELGLVPLGSIGLSLFVLDLAFVGSPYASGEAPRALLGIGEFLGHASSWRICLDLLLVAMFGGIFSVPLYTLVQQRSPSSERSRVIAGNNVMNSGFMVLASVVLLLLSALGFGVIEAFIVFSLMNAVVAIYIYGLLPEFLLRFVVFCLSKFVYRVKVRGRDSIPEQGPCLLVANHVSYVDWMLIAATCSRPTRFVMHRQFLKLPLLGVFFRDAKVIPIAPAHEDQGVLDEAFDRIQRELEAGEVVCIFPEGKLTRDGRLNPFRTGVERILARTPVPVVPIAIKGMWGSYFSHQQKGSRRPFRRVWSRVELLIGRALEPSQVTAPSLARAVADLGGFEPPKEA
jgi:1-acyl-sn-glycerol-3-phosphate acyltransferase